MNKTVTAILQTLVVLLGVATLALMLWEPHLEGRNATSTLYEVYFNDPFLAYAYVASLAFFIGLYQVFKLLGYMGRNMVYSPAAAHAARAIKYCAVTLAGLVFAPLCYLVVVRPEDDIAGGVAMGLFLIVGSAIVASAAAIVERKLQRSVAASSGTV